VDLCQTVVGSGADRQALADKMSQTWVAFARSGNPNHTGLPHWDPFNADQRATMMFNTECRAVNDPYRAARLATAAMQPARQSF
jgi:para-nitrobenzyl esterase